MNYNPADLTQSEYAALDPVQEGFYGRVSTLANGRLCRGRITVWYEFCGEQVAEVRWDDGKTGGGWGAWSLRKETVSPHELHPARPWRKP